MYVTCSPFPARFCALPLYVGFKHAPVVAVFDTVTVNVPFAFVIL